MVTSVERMKGNYRKTRQSQMPGNRTTLKTNKQPYSTKDMYTPDSVNNTYICKNASILITKIVLLLFTLSSSGHACQFWGLCDVAMRETIHCCVFCFKTNVNCNDSVKLLPPVQRLNSHILPLKRKNLFHIFVNIKNYQPF